MNHESHWNLKRAVPFKNVSGETIPAFAVMAVRGVARENGIAFLECARPSHEFVREYAVNNIFDVPPGVRGSCFRTGDVRALHAPGTPAQGEGWGPQPGQWTLARGYPATTIVGGSVHAGHHILLGSLAPIDRALVKTTALVAANTTTTSYAIYGGTHGTEVDLGYTSVPPARNRGATIADGSWCLLAWVNNGWELRQVERDESADRVWWGNVDTASIAAGNTGNVQLSTGGDVTARYWADHGTALDGERVFVWLDSATEDYRFIKSAARPAPRWFKATLDSPDPLHSADTAANVTTYAALDGGSHPGSVVAANVWAQSGQVGAEALIVESGESEGAPTYDLVQVQHVVREHATEVRFSGGTLEYKRQKITVQHEDAESGWQTIFTTVTTDVAKVISYSEAGHELYYTKLTARVFSTAGEANQSIVVADQESVVENVTFTGTSIIVSTKDVWTWPTAGSATPTAILSFTFANIVHDVFTSGTNVYETKSYAGFIAASAPFNELTVAGDLCDTESSTGSESDFAAPDTSAFYQPDHTYFGGAEAAMHSALF